MKFDQLTDRMDAAHAKRMGDRIRYTTADGVTIPQLACFVDYGDGDLDVGAGQLVEQDISIEIPKSSLVSKPSSGVRLVLPRRSENTFRPAEVATDANGTHWVITLKEVK